MSDMDPEDDLAGYGPVLTPQQVAEVLQMNQQHLVRLMREGRFPAFRIQGVWRVKRSALLAVMNGTWKPDH